ncbi:lysine 5,6-aminomutase reactivase ATPase KamC [Paramaledivibacter caminithermalis]|jgi:DNA mismatch repair ATPase MutS|uniref:MutS domain V n=1 Tax=Paramaledivibacter caminithermalis (strain DSM 15212 / CIP 107654 / DViRD3) TaxID=1121301 RepID=A0A1M6KFX0_PARC5|nr:DNA mismatch repair protein MutS [Paramaledivibacter caminithermalis]SHJ57895.1 MutS domain V [Paramaledivibacter caminithermalis DSM 15212]
MFISDDTARNIDLDFVFNHLTVYTPYGEIYKKAMRPYMPKEKNELIEELKRIEKVVNLIQRQRYDFIEMRNYFKHIKDLRLTLKRIDEGNVLSTTELFEIKMFIGLLKKLDINLQKLKWDIPKDIRPLPITYLEKLFNPEGAEVNTFYIYDEYSEKLAAVRKEIRDIENNIIKERKKLKEKVEKDLKVKLRPSGEITINKDNIELNNRLREHQLLMYSVETYMNITFKIKNTLDIDNYNQKLQELKLIEEDEEFNVRKKLSEEIQKYLGEIEKNIESIGRLDLLVAKGYHAIGFKETKPEIVDENIIYILNGRNIKVQQNLKRVDREFTPITLSLSKGVTCITGANMGGKTISLKTIGLLLTMAQYGLFVPAEKMKLSLKDYVFFSMGDLQSSDKGLSTFGGEILKIKEAIKDSDKEGLILIDELARGTNPKEGYAISKAIINYLKNKETITVITTHFDGLADDSQVKHYQVRGLSVEDWDKISEKIQEEKQEVSLLHYYMDYRLIEIKDIKEVPKDAINISRLMGLDEEILKDAEKILEKSSKF